LKSAVSSCPVQPRAEEYLQRAENSFRNSPIFRYNSTPGNDARLGFGRILVRKLWRKLFDYEFLQDIGGGTLTNSD
jgi:hypothetical protein